MNAPGEKLLIKLWETIAEKGVGSLLTPWKKRREGLAEIDIKRQELLMLAQTEIDVAAIRSGQKKLLADGTLSNITSDEIYKSSSLGNMARVANQNALADSIRKEVNLSKAIIYAENELANDSEEPSEEKIADDWLFRWKEFASKVSEEQIQQLWAKILAGEIKKPGKISYRLLDFIDKLSKKEIEDISKVFSIAMLNNNMIVRGVEGDTSYLREDGLEKDFFQKMGDLGVISQATTGAVNLSTNLDFSKFNPFNFQYNGFVLSIKEPETISDKKLGILYYKLTTLGHELFSISNVPSERKYLESLSADFTAAGAITELIVV